MSNSIIAGSSLPHDALEHVGACPACGHPGADRPIYCGVVDILGGTPGAWDIYECTRCDSLYLDPRPVGYGLSLAYKTYYTHESQPSDEGVSNGSLVGRLVTGYLAHRFGMHGDGELAAGRWLFPLIPPLRQQLDYFLRHLPRTPGSLLDVGCGNGAFLQRAARAGWNVEGIEPDEEAATVARRVGCHVTTATLDTYDGSRCFDAVTMSHVIEHVPDPKEAVRRARDLLVEGGTLWVATPNAASAGRRRYGVDWRGLEVPRHTVVFTPDSLARLLQDAGYEDIRFRRRGRGARYSLVQSKLAASRRHVRGGWVPVWWIDLLASFSSYAGEELVVTARKAR